MGSRRALLRLSYFIFSALLASGLTGCDQFNKVIGQGSAPAPSPSPAPPDSKPTPKPTATPSPTPSPTPPPPPIPDPRMVQFKFVSGDGKVLNLSSRFWCSPNAKCPEMDLIDQGTGVVRLVPPQGDQVVLLLGMPDFSKFPRGAIMLKIWADPKCPGSKGFRAQGDDGQPGVCGPGNIRLHVGPGATIAQDSYVQF